MGGTDLVHSFVTIFKKASLSPLGLLIATCLNASTAMAFHHRFPTNTNNCASPEKHFHNMFSILLEVGRLLERKRSLLSFHSDGHCPVIGAGTLPNQLKFFLQCCSGERWWGLQGAPAPLRQAGGGAVQVQADGGAVQVQADCRAGGVQGRGGVQGGVQTAFESSSFPTKPVPPSSTYSSTSGGGLDF